MDTLFRDYWWLIFPVWGMALGTWHGIAQYRQKKAMVDLIRTYAERGEAPPAALLASLTEERDDQLAGPRSPAHYWSLTGLFGVLAAGFGVASWVYGFAGAGWPFGVVSVVMAAVAVWSLINALILPRAKSS